VDGPLPEAAATPGFTLGIQGVVPTIRGGEGIREGCGGSDGGAHVLGAVRATEGTVRVLQRAVHDRCNSLPWETIGEALELHRMLPYLQGVVRAYLRDPCILYTGRATWYSAGVGIRTSSMEPSVRCGAQDTDSTGFSADLLCRRHVGASLGFGVRKNGSSRGDGGGLRGRFHQGIGAEGVPGED
jgi:hypothetical protein